MANNTVKVSIRVRNDTAERWTEYNPILSIGEFGLENDTLKLKIGDGHTYWNSLAYISSNGGGSSNTFDSTYFTTDLNGNITFTASFADSLILKDSNGRIQQSDDPVSNSDVANKHYVDAQIANAGHLTYQISIQKPLAIEAAQNTIYLVLDSNGSNENIYKEYMLINGALEEIGSTAIDLNNLLSTASPVEGNVVAVGNNGDLVDSTYPASNLGIATSNHLGTVKSSTDNNKIAVDNSGFMTLNLVSTSLLYTPSGDTLILDGGNSSTTAAP